MPECVAAAANGTPQPVTLLATQTRVDGKWSAPVLWCPGDTAPALAVAAIRDQAIRLLPKVTTGHAFRDAALVNTEEIFWADTTTNRSLPDVRIVGLLIHLQITLDHVTWDFGDGSTDTTGDPGRAYDTSDPCTTVDCPDYYGHVYRKAGTKTVTATITWHARYRIGDGAWTDIADPITGPDSTQLLRVVEARGVLVPNSR